MKTIYDRTRWLIGNEELEIIKKSKVIIFGVGGVGGFVIEALARVGIGALSIVDYDEVDLTNINRQIIALHSTVGRAKVEVMRERIGDINPEALVKAYQVRLGEHNIDTFHLEEYDYIVDAIDDVKAKLLLIKEAKSLGIPIISSMGTGNKKDPSQFKISDISKTHTCPLAKRMRKALSLCGIKHVKVLFSEEVPSRAEKGLEGHNSPASIAFVPGTAGLLIAGEVIKDLIDN